jgi:hypothetical protein
MQICFVPLPLCFSHRWTGWLATRWRSWPRRAIGIRFFSSSHKKLLILRFKIKSCKVAVLQSGKVIHTTLRPCHSATLPEFIVEHTGLSGKFGQPSVAFSFDQRIG